MGNKLVKNFLWRVSFLLLSVWAVTQFSVLRATSFSREDAFSSAQDTVINEVVPVVSAPEQPSIRPKVTKKLSRRDTVPDALFVLRRRNQKPSSQIEISYPAEKKNQKKGKENAFTRLWARLMQPSQDRTFVKPVDFSAAAVPNYSHEGSFGVGAMIALSYRLDKKDSTMPPSDMTLEGSASLRAFFFAKLIGNNYFPGKRHRLLYDVRFEQQDNLYWGLDFDRCMRNPSMKFTRTNISASLNYDYQIMEHLYLGAMLNFNYGQATHVPDITYFGGQNLSYMLGGIGVSFQYDSRDFPRYPYEGFNVFFRPMVYPSFAGDYGKTLWRFTFNANYFLWLWRGAVLGIDLFSEYMTPEAPWTLRQCVGGDTRLRGYYEGRYTDNNLVSVQLELRQKLFWRLGMVLFAGCGTVYPSLDRWDWSRIVPSYGIGLRLEFKKGINVRVDYALGLDAWRGEGGVFIVTMGESF